MKKLYSFKISLINENSVIFKTVQEDKDKAVDRLFLRFGDKIADVRVIGVEKVSNDFLLISEETVKEARLNSYLTRKKLRLTYVH